MLNAKAHFALAHEVAHILRRHETFELQSLVVICSQPSEICGWRSFP